jgi:WD40 repeat protein
LTFGAGELEDHPMLSRHTRALALLLVLALLGGAAAGGDDEEKKQPDDDSVEPSGKVEPVLNVGGHTGRIGNMVFSPDGKRLYTTGRPGELCEWNVESGERLHVWRFPQRVHQLAISPNGKQLASAGWGPPPKDGPGDVPIWLIDLNDRSATRKTVPGVGLVGGLAFAPKGGRLGVMLPKGKCIVLLGLGAKGLVEELPGWDEGGQLSFNPAGRWVMGVRNLFDDPGVPASVRLIDIRPKKDHEPAQLPLSPHRTARAVFSPDGKRVACISDRPSVQIWTITGHLGPPDWAVEREAFFKHLGLGDYGTGRWIPFGLVFRSDKELLGCWQEQDNGSVRIVRIDPDSKRFELLPVRIRRQQWAGGMALSPDGRYLAMASDPAYKIAVYDLKEQRLLKYPSREAGGEDDGFGPAVRSPNVVGWMPDGKGVVWGRRSAGAKTWHDNLTGGLSLTEMTPLKGKEERGKAVPPPALPPGWRIERQGLQGGFLIRPDKKVRVNLRGLDTELARTFTDEEGRRLLLVVWWTRQRIAAVDPETGKFMRHLGFFEGRTIYDLALSPDRKHLVVASGEQALSVLKLTRPPKELLRVLPHRSEWIAWTNDGGYYAGSPGGEQLIGWKVTSDDSKLPAFYPAQTFRKRLYRPEVMKNLLDAGSVETALVMAGQKAGVKGRGVEEMLPPQVVITKAEKDPKNDRKWRITAVEQLADEKKQPIEMLKLLVDGRPLPGDLSARTLKPGERVVTWEVPEMPAGEKVELKVLARGPDTYGVSQPKEIEVPAPLSQRPALHMVSVGLTYRGDKALDLGPCPANDATEIAKQFPASCSGPNNLFGRTDHRHLLLDKAADKAGVLAALAKVKKEVKPRDLVVFFYAGHGVNEKGEFFLLTHGADLKDLPKTALSGSALRSALGDFPCQVLVLLDACHSGKAGEALRNAGYGKSPTDEASRNLADEECSVTLIAAAMGHQRALQPAGGKHGFFTQAVLAALKRSREVTHNKFNGRQYVHHLFGDVFDEVQTLTEDRQHPTLSLPWTVESYPVCQVAAKKAAAP